MHIFTPCSFIKQRENFTFQREIWHFKNVKGPNPKLSHLNHHSSASLFLNDKKSPNNLPLRSFQVRETSRVCCSLRKDFSSAGNRNSHTFKSLKERPNNVLPSGALQNEVLPCSHPSYQKGNLSTFSLSSALIPEDK